MKGLDSKETVTLHRSEGEAQTFDLTTTKKIEKVTTL